MFRRIASMTGLIPLAVLGCLLSARSAAAQNQGYSVWAHRYDGGGGGSSGGGGWKSRGFYVPPSAPGTLSQSYYYAPREASPVNEPVTINVTVPADARISFDGSKTVQTGKQRRFFSPPLEPGHEYSYEVQATWTQDGHEVTQNRRITVHSGDILNLTFAETGLAHAR